MTTRYRPESGPNEVAVLTSGGLDSAILVANLASASARVWPVYVRFGLNWESAEQKHLVRFLQAAAGPTLAPLKVLDFPLADVYQGHWSLTGRDVPDAETPDDAVYLPGRNVLLLAKTAVWCRCQGIPAIALGPLKGNPFPDSTPEFFQDYERVLNRALGGALSILRPFASLSKRQVMERGRELPLVYTFSCIRPERGEHCGTCNKCAERRRAFRDAGLMDPTVYAASAGE